MTGSVGATPPLPLTARRRRRVAVDASLAAAALVAVSALAGCRLRHRRVRDAGGGGAATDALPIGAQLPGVNLALPARGDAGGDAADTALRFAPRWACRITGPGRVGRGPHVSVAPHRPNAEPGTIADAVPLHDGRLLTREPVLEAGGRATLAQGRITLRADAGGELASRTYDVVPGAVEMLFEDAQGAGVAFWNGSAIVGRYLASGAEINLPASTADVTRACRGPVTDPLRVVPVAPGAWEFPPIDGMPPSTADARWTLGRDAQGLCVARLEGEGPWGRVVTEAVATDAAAGELRGELSLAESLNPVTCAPR